MFPEKLRELRSKKGISQQKLADTLGVTQQAVAKWERGKSEPDTETIAKIARYFNVTTDYLLNYKFTSTAIAAHYEGPPNRELDLDDILEEEFKKFLEWKKSREKRKKK